MPAKLDRCVEEVEAKGTADNPWAVCKASTGLSDTPATPIGKPFKKAKPAGETDLKWVQPPGRHESHWQQK